jgi:hypothetical protein
MSSPDRVRDLRLTDSWEETRRHLSEIISDVREILGGGVGFSRHVDAITKSFQWVSSSAPIVVDVTGVKRPPLGILVLDALWSRGDEGGRASGLGIEWQWLPQASAIRVDDVLNTIPGTFYNVTIMVIRS